MLQPPNLPASAKDLLLPRLHFNHRCHLGAVQVDLGVDLGLREKLWGREGQVRSTTERATVGTRHIYEAGIHKSPPVLSCFLY